MNALMVALGFALAVAAMLASNAVLEHTPAAGQQVGCLDQRAMPLPTALFEAASCR